MEKEYVSGDGRIFRKDLKDNYHEVGGKGISVSGRDMKAYEKYTGVKTEKLTHSAKKYPRFARMMNDIAKQ